MSFTKLLSFTKKVADLADKPSGTPAEIKAQFDAAPDEVRQYFNDFIDAIKSTTSGDSGAKNIGATSIPGLVGNDIQTLLERLSERGALYGKGSATYNSGFFIFPVSQWITEMNSDLYSQKDASTITFKKSGLYEVNFSCTRSDLVANQYWQIGFSINDDPLKLITEKMTMGQYGWNQSSGPNLAKVPLQLNHLVRVSANDYIDFNSSSEDGPRSYELKFNVKRISD